MIILKEKIYKLNPFQGVSLKIIFRKYKNEVSKKMESKGKRILEVDNGRKVLFIERKIKIIENINYNKINTKF